MYDPTAGRWTTEDPVAFAGGDANLDRYVHNGPTNATDPTGLALAVQETDPAIGLIQDMFRKGGINY